MFKRFNLGLSTSQNTKQINNNANKQFVNNTLLHNNNLKHINQRVEPRVEPRVEQRVEPRVEQRVEPRVEPRIEQRVEPRIEQKEYIEEYINVNDIIITRNIDGTEYNPKYIITNLNQFNNFILIVDFHNGGGGTTFFLNSIVSKYKHNVNLLIVRNINDKLVVNVNEEYLLNQTFTELESLVFLDTIKDKIIKIFVNHTLRHTQTFIQKLFTLNKEVTTITHDYLMLFNKYNPYYLEIPTLERNPIDINLYDQIITQNASNLTIYNKYLTGHAKIIVCPLPDYKNSKTRIDTNNNKIIIGIIGAIGEIKGKIFIENLIKYYKTNSLVKIIIFGILDNYDYAYKYNNINELNYLLIKHKPNILLETSLWPETYSYTLTIKKLTQLPIFYLNKQFDSVIVNRLTEYDKKYMFNTINDIDNIILQIKQDYFYTIEPIIYFPKFWTDYFNTTATNNFVNNLVIITSKIYVSSNILSYTPTRSIHTVTDRFNQTIDTINSIKKYIPNPFIILIDNSVFENKDFLLQLKHSVDNFINITDDNKLNYYTDCYEYKAFAEMYQLLNVYKILKQMNLNSHKFKNMFKISGRYVLNNTFNYKNYNNSNNIIKQNMTVTDRIYWYTSFYKININFINKLFDSLQIIFDNKEQYTQYDLEVIFSMIFKDNFTLINHLGLTQNVSVWNDTSDI